MSIITIMTAQGRAQLAAAVANAQTFPSTKIVVGDGNGAVYAPNESQVALVHEVWRGNAAVARTDDRVIFSAIVPPEVGGFIVREVGVLIGEVGSEQLFIISQHPSTEKIASPANGSGPLPVTIAFSANASEQAVLPIGSSDRATALLSRPPHITVDDLLTAPPGLPADGAMYAIDAGASGVFIGKAGWIVERVAGGWIYTNPPARTAIRLATNGNWFEKQGADWIALNFNDPAIFWADIADPPETFPPSVHNHDERYFTETESDGRFVKKAGDTMTGTLTLATVGNANGLTLEQGGGARYSWYLSDQGGGNYNQILYGYGGAAGNGNRVIFSHTGDIQQVVGSFGVGIAPTAKLDVNGDAKIRGNAIIVADTGGKQIIGRYSAGFPYSIIEASAGSNGMSFQFAGTQQFQFTSDGGLGLGASTDVGTATKVLVGGSTASWVDIASLHPGGVIRGRYHNPTTGLFTDGGLVAGTINATGYGVNITAVCNIAGGYWDFTFSSALSATTYTADGLARSGMSNITVNGFRYTPPDARISQSFSIVL